MSPVVSKTCLETSLSYATMMFLRPFPMLIGYARVSTEEQDTGMQRDALSAAGCERLFEETASGARVDRAELQAAINFARRGDTIVVWKLDRLARSLS